MTIVNGLVIATKSSILEEPEFLKVSGFRQGNVPNSIKSYQKQHFTSLLSFLLDIIILPWLPIHNTFIHKPNQFIKKMSLIFSI